MKNCIVLLLAVFLMFSGAAVAQNVNVVDKPERRERGVYFELLGASNLVGLSYDSRIKSGSRYGYRVGISYAFSSGNAIFDDFYRANAVSLPLEFNCLLGSWKNKFEVGLGLSLGVYSSKSNLWKYEYIREGDYVILVPTEKVSSSSTSFGYYIFANVGYRLITKRGFMFRVGVTPSFNFGDHCGVDKDPFLYPYISFGYSF